MKPRSLASRLRHLVDIEVKNRADNGVGGRKVPAGQAPWLSIAANIPAEVLALRGDEAVRLGIERSTQLWRVTVRPRGDIDTKARLVWGAITMDIKSAALDLSGNELVMTCESGLPAS